MGWDGLTREAKEACSNIRLGDITENYITREKIKEAIVYHNMAEVKEEMQSENYKKLNKIKYGDFREMQLYMKEKSLEDSRMEFLWLTDMLDTRHSAADFRLERTSSRSTILCVSAGTRAAAVDA